MGKYILFLKEKNFGEIVKSEMIDTLTKDFRSKLLKSDRGGLKAQKDLRSKKSPTHCLKDLIDWSVLASSSEQAVKYIRESSLRKKVTED